MPGSPVEIGIMSADRAPAELLFMMRTPFPVPGRLAIPLLVLTTPVTLSAEPPSLITTVPPAASSALPPNILSIMTADHAAYAVSAFHNQRSAQH
jgi:hypothetical protein